MWRRSASLDSERLSSPDTADTRPLSVKLDYSAHLDYRANVVGIEAFEAEIDVHVGWVRNFTAISLEYCVRLRQPPRRPVSRDADL